MPIGLSSLIVDLLVQRPTISPALKESISLVTVETTSPAAVLPISIYGFTASLILLNISSA